MAMEIKVDREELWDATHNNGRIMREMVSITIRHAADVHEGSEFSINEVHEAEKVLESYGIIPAYGRIVEWLSRAAQNLLTMPLQERKAIEWTGSDRVTDINAYRQKDKS